MYYVIQENTFREENYDLLVKTIESMGLDYEIVQVLPYTDEMEYKTDRKDVFIFGSLKIARIAKNFGWYPASLMNDNHDYEVYKNYYKENLLNYDSVIHNFSDDIIFDTEYKFIRPCLDTKIFTGGVFNKDEWEAKKEIVLNHSKIVNSDTKIQVAEPTNIYKEIRFWVVDGEVITGSQYRLGGRVCYDKLYDEPAKEFAQAMVDKFQLAKAFVIDVCLVSDGWKIVEAGCINCAGFYHADLYKVIVALENLYEN